MNLYRYSATLYFCMGDGEHDYRDVTGVVKSASMNKSKIRAYLKKKYRCDDIQDIEYDTVDSI